MGPINLKQTGYTFMAMNMQDKLTNKGHLFFSVWYLTKLIQQFYLRIDHTIQFRIFKANFFGFSLKREGFIISNRIGIFFIWIDYCGELMYLCIILFSWVKWKLKFGDYKKDEIPFIFYLLCNIKLKSWLDSFWCLIFVEFDRNECFQIWHKFYWLILLLLPL